MFTVDHLHAGGLRQMFGSCASSLVSRWPVAGVQLARKVGSPPSSCKGSAHGLGASRTGASRPRCGRPKVVHVTCRMTPPIHDERRRDGDAFLRGITPSAFESVRVVPQHRVWADPSDWIVRPQADGRSGCRCDARTSASARKSLARLRFGDLGRAHDVKSWARRRHLPLAGERRWSIP
jgi:hypothetical protein